MNKLLAHIHVGCIGHGVRNFASTMTGAPGECTKEVPTFVVAPTEVPTQKPVIEPTDAPVDPLPGQANNSRSYDAPEVVPLIEAAAEWLFPGAILLCSRML